MTPEQAALVAAHEPLVRTLAWRVVRSLVHHPDVEAADVLQAGRRGLCQAALRYRPETGVPFDAYARLVVRGAMLDLLRANAPVSGLGCGHWERGRATQLSAILGATLRDEQRARFELQAPEVDLGRRLDARRLPRLVAALPWRQRVCVEALVLGRTWRETAGLLGCRSEGIVHHHRRLGLARLRRWLGLV